MNDKRWWGIVLLAVVGLAGSREALAQDWKKKLTTDLESVYALAKTSRMESNQVTQPGAVLVIQQENINADHAKSMVIFSNPVREGVVSAPGGAGGFFSKRNARALRVGERVYMTDIDVKDERIRFSILTLDMYDTEHDNRRHNLRYRAVLDVEIPRAELPTMDAAAVKKILDGVLLLEAEAQAAKTIELGQTIEQVEKILGKPQRIVKLGEKTTYFYPDMKVIFADGKVADVQ